ncbi:hypothetical protein AVEN_48936-1 [Araneus ventricosus]|uniref:Uncharacterized protein n=1 Tax=Araneus ventricosus TaxID=182803 RepID=A0A4Y2AGM0_ARAVE|nr:hypothetical protein AVEN_48936-1 [Araneus ventricosus]
MDFPEGSLAADDGNMSKVKQSSVARVRAHVGYSGDEAVDVIEGNTGGNPHIHPSAKKSYQESASKRVHYPLAKRMGQWRNRQECLQRFV